MVGILSRHLGPWSGSTSGAGQGRGWEVWWGFREALTNRRLGERWTYGALVERTGRLGGNWWRVLHEVRVRGHVASVAMVAGSRGSLRVIVVRRDRRLGSRRPQVGGAVILRGAVLAWRHSSSGTSTIMME